MSNRINLPTQVQHYIQTHQMLQTGDLILVGLSGGGDSVCLLCVLKELQTQMGFSLAALHVHHGIRGQEADEDAYFCQQLCQELNIPCHVVRVDVPAVAAQRKLSLEEAARLERYRELERYRQQLEERRACGGGAEETGSLSSKRVRIAVAHHREDQAETVLWNLFRGSGLKGLGGMAPVNGTVIRPLLGTSKQEIQRYLEERRLPWRQDATNDGDEYTRNRIRHHVLGYAVEEINEQSAEHICQAASVAAQADGYLRRQAQTWLSQKRGPASALEGAPAVRKICLDVADLVREEEILQTYILREAAALCGSLTNVTARHLEAVRALLTEMDGGKAFRRVELTGGLNVSRRYGQLIIEKTVSDGERQQETSEAEETVVDLNELWQQFQSGKEPSMTVTVGANTFRLRIFLYEKTQKIPTNQYTKWVNYDKIGGTLVFRSRRTGDYILLPNGGRKTVQAYMIDEKIPAEERAHIPVVAQGSHALWIAGYRLSEGAKITNDTQYVLEIKMHGG